MNAATDLLTNLQNLGVSLSISGDKIRVKAPVGAVTEDLRRALAERKPEIIDLLSRRKTAPPRLPVVWHFFVDGKGVTAIDPEHMSAAEFGAFLNRKFGPGRVTDLQPMREKI